MKLSPGPAEGGASPQQPHHTRPGQHWPSLWSGGAWPAKLWFLWPSGSWPLSLSWSICFSTQSISGYLATEGAPGIRVNMSDLFQIPAVPL